MKQTNAAREHMIDCQLRPNEVNDERLISAVRAVAREHFVPKTLRSVAYADEDISVGGGRYLMEPMVFARLMDFAKIQEGDLVLDIGCATGYSSAVLAGLAGAVVALECDDALYEAAEKKLTDEGVMNAAVVKGDLDKGVAKQGPYDVIFCQGAVDDLPKALLKQLKDGGRLVCVKKIGGVGRALLVTRSDDDFQEKILFDANVADLPGFQVEKGFTF
ncbi:protein-L-isoaspartate O-methyltransferase family protein [Kordiimonas sediminis]|uniref:protein-L-isoaspartate O-methyltransferase family protein n=1 Tax=Kordiimonas sediminis TaxID=1735581 RepID=UPI001E2AF2F7|nr:protein-L-isoaspartate O-methyltransferase [Kordiimonas sediminis]